MVSQSGRFCSPPLSAVASLRIDRARRNAPAISIGEQNSEAVRAIQCALLDLDDPLIDIPAGPTGHFLDQTRNAVKAFQGRYGLFKDGQVGAQTLAKLDEMLAKRAAQQIDASRLLGCFDEGVCASDRLYRPDGDSTHFAKRIHSDIEDYVPVGFSLAEIQVAVVWMMFGFLCYLALKATADLSSRRRVETSYSEGELVMQDPQLVFDAKVEILSEIAEDVVISAAMSLRTQCEQKHPEKIAECAKKHALLVAQILRTLRNAIKSLFATYSGYGAAGALGEIARALANIPKIYDRLKEALCLYLQCMGCADEMGKLKCPDVGARTFVPVNQISSQWRTV